jgi:hypothetical protein
VKYAIRIPANDSLERNIAELPTRPMACPSHKPVVRCKSFLYQAASWKIARRMVAKVEFHFGEWFYKKWGTAERWIKEGKQVAKMTRLSGHRFRSDEVRLWLGVLAYNPGNPWWRLVLAKKIENWTLSSLQRRLVKAGSRLVNHARYW